MAYQHITVAEDGQKIRVNTDFPLAVAAEPNIPFIEGDGRQPTARRQGFGICDRGHPPHG
jgi:hypothetical protein